MFDEDEERPDLFERIKWYKDLDIYTKENFDEMLFLGIIDEEEYDMLMGGRGRRMVVILTYPLKNSNVKVV